jgi:hypothetical protein
MGNSKTEQQSRHLRRLTREGSGVVTINIRSSRILLFWASTDLLVPIEQGWYFHAASVAGRTSVVDGERRLDAEFDLKDSKVRWQHAKVSRLGQVDLVLDTGRRYVFFLTHHQADRYELLRNHLPWPFQLRSPKAAGEPSVIVFQAWPVELDYHRAEDRNVISPHKQRDTSLISFDSWEHESTAEARTNDGRSVQDMIDMWALRGLIDGGAMVNTQGDFTNWRFWCPHEDSRATPTNPYALTSSPAVNNPFNATWHYVIPEKQYDEQSKAERPWTASALKKAVESGRAVALTVGQVIMLAGDDFEFPYDMENDADRWKNPLNIMRVYWEARGWLETQKKLLNVVPGTYWWDGYQQRYGVVYLVFELLMSSPKALESPDTVDEMDMVGKGEYHAPEMTGSREIPTSTDPSRLRTDEARWLKFAFNWLVVRAGRVDAMVDLLRQASGASKYTEMHYYSQTLSSASKGKGGTLGWLKSVLPWLTHLDLERDLTKAGFTQDEINWFKTNGIDDQLMQIVGSNGNYADLGFKNWTHFSAGGLNFQTFAKFHRQALDLVTRHVNARDAAHPIPARAIFLTAFGCHFFTDAFSASHMRVPRKKLGAFSAKLMHDVDGLVGLWVYTDDPVNAKIWYAFGDTYLHSSKLSPKQLSFASRGLARTNFEYAAAAVGSAFKQLHYQAHSVRQTEPKPPGSSPANPTLQSILDFNGPTAESLSWEPGSQEERKLEDVLAAGPSTSDLPKATRLRNESVAPGDAGPARQTMWEHLRLTTDGRIAFLKSLVPIPLPTAAKSPKGAASSIHAQVNIPPLFHEDGKLNLGKDNPYDIVTGDGLAIRGFTHYAGFSLRVNWGHFGDFSVDAAELRLNYDKYYFMTKFFRDVHGLEDYMDKTLLEVRDKLPKEKA